jgi:hypothetical protein
VTSVMTHTHYLVRYSFRSPEKASSLRAALTLARYAIGVRRLTIVRCADGLYLYRDRASMLRDDTGARAAATVAKEEGVA